MIETEANGQNQEATSELKFLENLLTGRTLQQIRDEYSRLETCRDETSQLLARLTSTDRSIVRGVLKEILSKEDLKTMPVLEKIVFEETPQHSATPLLLAAMRANVPVWLYGDTGSGKTTSAAVAADMLHMPFRFISVCPTTTKSEFFGYKDGSGIYHSTAFREMYEGGGVFLIDEIDNGNPSVLSVLNTALANEWCSFPDGNIKRNEKTVFLAAANTIGRGADVRYVGRNALDATTLDRFVYIRMDIDENLENAITGGQWDSTKLVDISEGGSVETAEWVKFVRSVRSTCNDLGLDHIVSPRASIYGIRLIAAGVGRKHLEDMCIYKGLRETDKKKIVENIKKNQNQNQNSRNNEPQEMYFCNSCYNEHKTNSNIGIQHREYKRRY